MKVMTPGTRLYTATGEVAVHLQLVAVAGGVVAAVAASGSSAPVFACCVSSFRRDKIATSDPILQREMGSANPILQPLGRPAGTRRRYSCRLAQSSAAATGRR